MKGTRPNKRQKTNKTTAAHATAMWKRGKAPLVPVTVVTGFLGSGKTTLLNHILNHPSHQMKFAIIGNDIGRAGIREMVRLENVDEEIIKIKIMNSCICCTVRGDLVLALKKLYNKLPSFNAVIIETTGMADPDPIIQTFFVNEDIQRMYELDSVITVVDAKSIVEQLNDKKPKRVDNRAVTQVVFADKIILNKMDLLPSAFGDTMREEEANRIEARLRQLNSTAPILRATFCKIPPKEVLNLQAFDLRSILEFEPEFASDNQENHHDSLVVSTACKLEGEFIIEKLSQWIERLIRENGANLYRCMGVMAIKGKERKFVFHGVGMLFSASFEGRWEPRERRESRFVFTGKNLDSEFLKIGFQACLVGNDHPRFAIGAPVLANCGNWKKGMVVRHWDNGNIYRIRLEESGQEVWAPLDTDDYVRNA